MYEINSRLIEIAKNLDLDLVFADINRSGFYFADEKVIFLSSKLLNQNSDFEISHELGHCIQKHEELAAFYNATNSSRRKLEREANKVAIQILLEIFMSDHDLDKEQLNAVKFMEYYQISSDLEDCVKESMLNYV
ncbi:ImmA/IrrE family metallo-endopeptidase [Vagococcus silagei]|uniref:ImmA/IrrE family metallo-endopeptidase n=1 Tax=Vagococcus silagei TaxID=2508885 RepID=A0A4S3B848_9ENTE|nr:ImmA/IrrE family metallo-endopeptidase [Vagococcus silagei]THB62183.1 ImmA/IrrE family metallo-endopeptidase [Vagococcus silagei]